MHFSVTSRRPGGVGQPPARLRGTMENASTGQMRSRNPPPACGAACARARRSRFGVWPHGKAHSARPVGSRMRFSVTTRPQNASFREGPCTECAFPHLGKRGVASRKSAFCNRGVTKKRTLRHPSRGAITQGAPFREERRHPLETHSAPVDFSNAQSRSSHPSPHCHLALSVPVTLPLDPERSRPARSPPSGSVSCTATRPRAFLLHCHSALNVPLRYD